MSQSQILIHQLNFKLPDGTDLFKRLSLTFANRKIGLVGRNGVGKSTLIKLIQGECPLLDGSIQVTGSIAYVPQEFSYAANATVAEFLGVADKLAALSRITAGSIDERDFAVLNDDWEIVQRIKQQLAKFGLHALHDDRLLSDLSGGELTRLMLTRAFLSQADFLILDEPTNHLDHSARQQLYEAINTRQGGLIVISHDRALLNLMDEIVELTSLGASCYGGNYDAYAAQKAVDKAASQLLLHDAKKQMLKTRAAIQASHEKHERKQSRGRDLRQSGSIDKLSANSKRGRSERTQHRLLVKEERMMQHAESELKTVKEKIEILEEINIDLPETYVPNGKVMIEMEDVSFSYQSTAGALFKDFNFMLTGRERVALAGDNGSGKTTLIKLILAKLRPQSGTIMIGTRRVSYLDQHASLLEPALSLLENFLKLNPDANENDAYRYLAQFLFRNKSALKYVKDLSGGEKLRALLAIVLTSREPPQLLILDEPTNHLDLQSIASIESALNHYQGALLVVSHDRHFLTNIGVTRELKLMSGT